MKAVVCTEPMRLEIVEREVPSPAAGEALVRIRRIGICGTDMHIYQGDQPYFVYPRVMGHELSGEIEAAPAGSRLRRGDQVCVLPYLSCGHCIACRRGKTNCCTSLNVLGVHCDGGMAEYLCVPETNLYVAEGLGLDELAMVEFLAIGAHAVRRARLAVGERVLVAGAGPIGMAVMIFAKLAGAEVTGLDLREDRLAVCRDELGINHCVKIGDGDKEELSRLSGAEFFDAVFDATGNIAAMQRGLEFVGHGGAYVLVSIVRDNLSFPDPEFHKRETSLLGSRNATPEDFAAVVSAMRAGLVPTRALRTHVAALVDLPEAMPKWLRPEAGVVKAILEV